MEELRKNNLYEYISSGKWSNLHEAAFKETYEHLSLFSEEANKINVIAYNASQSKQPLNEEYILNALCSPPGHGKTTALELHIKKEMTANTHLKRGFMLVFLNEDNMNSFVHNIQQFCNENFVDASILAVTERNYLKLMNVFESYQILCITQQRFRDLSFDFKGVLNFYKYYLQEMRGFGNIPRDKQKRNQRLLERTVIVDEMPIFFNDAVFDLGAKDNILDWYDLMCDNTPDELISAKDKDKARKQLNRLFNSALYAERNATVQLMNPIKGMEEEDQLKFVLENLNTSNIAPTYLARKQWFEDLLHNEGTGVLLKSTSRSKIICSKFIHYGKSFGNILILDGTSDLTQEIYKYGKFKLIKVHNYNNYAQRMLVYWREINTSSSKRNDRNSNVREQISEDIISIRNKGVDILPIPNLSDKSFYIESGAITEEQYKRFFKGREFEGDTLAINLHNVTGRNELSNYPAIGLLNLPILSPQAYRLQAIAIHGTDKDLRLVSELDNKERVKHTGKWFVDNDVQKLFEQNQKAILSQIIHRTKIRNLNAEEVVFVYMYHNQPQVNTYLQEIFNLPDESIQNSQLYLANKFRNRTREWAEQIQSHLKSMPNVSVTATKSGGGAKFKKWINDYWDDHQETIRKIFKECDITVEVKGKGGYKYFTYVDDGIFKDVI